jgi:uncharacterized repeat protein (TIGR03847 family)
VSESFDLKAPERFTVGTQGPPGQRVFYLQAREGDLRVTLKVEKEHVQALGEYLARMLGQRPPATAVDAGDLALEDPIEPAWDVRALGVGYDEAADRLVIVAEELVDAEAAEEAASARFHLTRAQAAGLVERARALVRAGRPACPVCGHPQDPAGHRCARRNGHFVGRP